MTDKCSKCLTESTFLVKYTDLEEIWALCGFCNRAFDKQGELLKEFMKEDFGSFPLSPVTKSMILARIARAKGESPWNQTR